MRYLDKEFFPELDAYLPEFEYPKEADKIYKKAVEEYKDKFTKEDKGFINKLKSFFADGGRAGFSNGGIDVLKLEDEALKRAINAFKYYQSTGGKKNFRDYLKQAGERGDQFRADGGVVK